LTDETVSQDSTPVEQPETEVDSSVQAQEQTDEVQGQSQEETFFDPNAVPEELKPAYKQMQAAFTRKTQEIAQARKELEAIKARADAYAKYEPYVPIIEEMLSSQAQPASPELMALEQELRSKGYSDEAIDLMKSGAQVILNQLNQTRQAEREMQAIEVGINEAEKLDPRLNDQNLVYTLEDGSQMTFGEIVADLVTANPEWRSDPVGATKKAIAKVEALIGKAKTEGKEELSTLAKGKAQRFPPVSSSPRSAADGSQPKTIREAAALAEKQLGI